MTKRRCRLKTCRKYGDASQMMRVPLGFFCGMECATAYGKQNAAKAQHKAHREQKAEFRAKDTATLQKAAQAAVNRLCKLLDAGKPCISCGRPDEGGRKRNAGHYKSRGANSALRFDLRNIHQQCVVCNLYQSGNIAGYTEGLRDRYGQAVIDYLESAPRLKQWTPDELRAITAEARAECKRLEKGEGPSKDWRQLPQRRQAA